MSFVSMRDELDKVNVIFEQDVGNLAVEGATNEYMIISICIGLVILAEAIIIPFFSRAIQEKSRVIAIFADIEIDEIKEIIETQIVDLRKIKFKKSWITESEGNFNVFWDKVIKAHKVLKEKVKKPEGFSDVVKKVESKTDEEENKKEEDLEKATKRKECLSEIEYNKIKLFFSNGLRIRSISRVLGVLFFSSAMVEHLIFSIIICITSIRQLLICSLFLTEEQLILAHCLRF